MARSIDFGGVPHRLDGALDALPPGTVVLNEDRLGGWIMLRHGQIVPTIDSRFEAYGPAVLQRHIDLVEAHDGWEQQLAATAPAAVLLSRQHPLCTHLADDPQWAMVGEDSGYMLLVSRALSWSPPRPVTATP